MSTDYNPFPVAVAPSADSITLTKTGAEDYGSPKAASAAVGSDSATLTDGNKFSRIGHDQTDAAAVAKVLTDEGKV